MKKFRSPAKQSLTNLLAVEREEPRQAKQVSILSKTHDQQHRRNANSIRKVLRQLQDLKKDLSDLRRSKRHEAIPEEMDNSKCRRLKAQTKLSSPSPDPRSHSSSKNKSSLSHQKEVSTQTKRALRAQTKDFSFTGGQTHSPKQLEKPLDQSEEEDSQEYNPFSLRTNREGHSEYKKKQGRSGHKEKKRAEEQIQSIEASQLYQKYLSSLKNSFSLLQISSPAFSGEDRLKLNLQLQRLSNQIRRIPIYIRQPQQHYQNVTVYARNLNNQLNHMAVLLNRCEPREKLRQRPTHESNQMTPCKNCQENQKKDWQRCHKRQLRRIEKEIGKLQGQLQKSRQEVAVLTTQNLLLMKEKQDNVGRCAKLEQKIAQEERKLRFFGQERVDLQRETRQAQSRRIKEAQRAQLLQEDLNYYKTQLDRVKKNGYGLQRNKQQDTLVTELKQKELLYQAIIRDKESQIADLKQKINDLFEELSQQLSHQRGKEGQGGLKGQLDEMTRFLQEKGRELANSGRETEVWRLRANKLQIRNKQLQGIVEQCTAEIGQLHQEINSLQEAVDSYRQKSLRNKSKNEGKSRRQEGKSRKDSAFQELNELIRNHRSNIENQAIHK